MDHQMVSLADQVFEVLEHDILAGKYQRGDILTETKLSEQLRVSRTPIREALKRLAMEHIIENTVKGAVVIGILPEDIADIYDIRLRVEGMVVARATAHMSEDELKEIQETLDLQEFYTARHDSENIKNMDSKFHQLIYEHCGSNTFCDMLEPLHRRIAKYRAVSISHPERAKHALTEHRAIFKAMAERNAELAEKLTIEHIAKARESILSNNPDM